MTTKRPGQWMAEEMAEQPEVLRRLAARRPGVQRAVLGLRPDGLRGVTLVARGSSDNAAIFGRYLIELATRVPVSLAAPSLHTLYDATPDLRGHLVVAVSQSGRTPEIVTVVERCRAAGAVTVGITNEPDSPLGSATHVVIALGAGAERAVPATKTFTAQLAAFALLAEALGAVPFDGDDWERVPVAVADVLADSAAAEEQAGRLAGRAPLITVARGLLYPVALEAALKLKETALVHAEGFSVADLRHGPIAVMDRHAAIVTFAAPGPARDDVLALGAEAESRGATVVRVGVASGEGGAGAVDLTLPPELPEALQCIPATVRAQQLALHLALLGGHDPDRPAGLSKVTATR